MKWLYGKNFVSEYGIWVGFNFLNSNIMIIVGFLKEHIKTNQIMLFSNNRRRQVHLELSRISRSINEIHGIQIVVQLGGYFILLTVVAYDFYVTYMMLELSGREVKMGILIIAFAIAFEKIFVINYMSAEASSEVSFRYNHRVSQNRDNFKS